MKYRILLLLAFVTTVQVNAQIWVQDSIQMGPNYGNDVFYSLTTGTVGTPVSNTNWQLGFEMLPGGPGFGGVSIIANHVQGGVKVYSLHTTGTAKFASLSASDTIGKTQLYNADSSWDYGAFNVNLSGIFDYGWGKYNPTTHHINGDSLYLINFGGNDYKMVVTHNHTHPVDSMYYAFHIAKTDNTADYMDTIWRKPNFEKKNFAYFDIAANTSLNREPDNKTWDILFARYLDYKAGPPGGAYPTMGVLSNVGVTVADVRMVNPDTTVTYNAYPYTKTMNEIGFDWKIFTPPVGPYSMDTTATFFVKSIDNGVYQIKFTKFESGSGPSGTGKVVFAKRMWVAPIPVNVAQVTSAVSTHMLAPNPAGNDADMLIDVKEASANAMMVVTDMTGKTILANRININKGLNAFRINTSSFATGNYIVTVTDGNWKIADKLVVQH